ncbi:ABC transporter ATP-binding protein [Algibacter lectus]|uniref:ABC transporter ATP-binding protein n=1 Tax=Algibacter lectus TaxID=221126 RepID=A0A090WM57_9FLAO|nr:ABC transporter ATP-binding protein [Algibacter lectus]
MVAIKYGKDISLQFLRDNCFITRDGVSLLGIGIAAEKIGFNRFVTKLTSDDLEKLAPFPCILHWNQNHFVVLYGIKRKLLSKKRLYKVADPARGLVTINEQNFTKSWYKGSKDGVALLLDPTEKLNSFKLPEEKSIKLKYLLNFLKPYKKEVFQLLLGLFAGSLFSLIFPFLTQALIDKGIENNSLNIVFLILLAQVFIFLGFMVIEIVRNWVMLYIGARVNITIISNFLKKILQLPIRFFDTKQVGDFNQRIQDHARIEKFLTSQSLITMFSLVNFSVFLIVLLYYDYKILTVFTILTAIAIIWSILFLKKRKTLDYYLFQNKSENQESIYELINGVQEIKLNNFENYKRREWEKIQIKLFGVNLKLLKLNQFQLLGYDFINQLKNILVTFIAAREVIIGNITLGEMLAVAYIIGQMNSPYKSIGKFFQVISGCQFEPRKASRGTKPRRGRNPRTDYTRI